MIDQIDANLVMVNILSTESKSTGSHPQKSWKFLYLVSWQDIYTYSSCSVRLTKEYKLEKPDKNSVETPESN